MKAIAFFLFFITLCSGCNSQAPKQTFSRTEIGPSSEPGWLAYNNANEGLRMTLPATWKQISLEADKIEAGIRGVSKDPSAVKSLTAYVHSRAEAGVGFIAIDSGGTAIMQLSWKQSDKNSPINLDSLAETWTVNAGMMGTQLTGTPSHGRVKLPIGEAQLVRYTSTESVSTQYLVGHGSDIYIISFSVNPADSARYDSVISRIGNSFESTRE